MTNATQSPRRTGRSIRAVAAGFITVVVLSPGTDQIFHVLNVYPPWNQPMNANGVERWNALDEAKR